MRNERTGRTVKLLCLIVLPIIFFSFYVNADSSYNSTGYNEYVRGNGLFNENLDFDLITDGSSVPLDVPKRQALSVDMDGDGQNEIIIVDNDDVRIYDNDLNILDSITVPSSENTNIGIYDIDGDSYGEFITGFFTAGKLFIINYSDGELHNQSILDISGLTKNGFSPDMAWQCRSANDCLLTWTDKNSSLDTSDEGMLFAMTFNSTSLSPVGEKNILNTSGTGEKFCFPAIRHVEVADYDNDGVKEYIYTAMEDDGSSQLAFYIIYVNSVGGTVSLEKSIFNSDSSLTVPDSCTELVQRSFTPPTVFDVDDSIGNGLETMVAYQENDHEFKIRKYKSDSNYETFPSLALADGVIISNVARANIFPDDDYHSFCVMGYDAPDDMVDLLCGNDIRSFALFDNVQMKYSVADLWELTYNIDEGGIRLNNHMIHSGQFKESTTEKYSIDVSEIITPYGIFEPDIDSCSVLTGNCDMSLIWQNPIENGAVTTSDIKGDGYEDMLVLTDTNLWLLTDGFQNSGGVIQRYSINPCIESAWKINTSLEIRVLVYDSDNDKLSARVTLYSGDSNEQVSEWSANVSSGTYLSFTEFLVNKTISNGFIKIEVRDTHNPSDIDSKEIPFSVGNDGVIFNQCYTTSEDFTVSNALNASIAGQEAYTNQNNRLRTGMIDMANLAGVPIFILSLAIIIVVDLIIISSMFREPFLAFLLTVVIDFFVVLLLSIMGFIGTAILITLSAIILIIGGVFLAQAMNRVLGGSG